VLLGGDGEGTMELSVTQALTEVDVRTYQRWLGLPGRSTLVNVEIRVRGCVFEAPGRYAVTLRFDGQELTNRPFDVFRE
jgi:Family of unknown function (DUF6941)